jgi:hypothetical protein
MPARSNGTRRGSRVTVLALGECSWGLQSSLILAPEHWQRAHLCCQTEIARERGIEVAGDSGERSINNAVVRRAKKR